jgi:Ferritin-like domain
LGCIEIPAFTQITKFSEGEDSMKTELVEKIVNSAADRRSFMKRVGATSLGLAAMTMLGGGLTQAGAQEASATASKFVTDVEILNFALNLEYLEAEFYLMATYGTTLVRFGVITADDETGPTTGGKMVNFSGASVSFIASGLRTNEVDHVKFLRTALGAKAVKKPAINLDALGYGFASVDDFLKLSRQFEDVGVSAYLGAAPLIHSKTYLAAAAAILATEAQHSGAIRTACVWMGVDSPAVDSFDVPPTATTPFDVDSNALSIPRTTSQVLNIVYGGGTCSGGFYPDGMNGKIVCQS